MARGPKKHLKRLRTPKGWMLDKLSGIMATRPSQGPHKLRECLPLSILLRHRLKYALTGREALQILKDKEANVRIDGRTRRDIGFPAGVMDVISIEKTNENFRVLYDTKGRFVLKALKDDEAKFKLLKVVNKAVGPNKVPYIVTHDARTIRYPHPEIQIDDTLKFDLKTSTVSEITKLEIGNIAYITGGNNIGRVGLITNLEKHPGSFDIVHIRDTNGKIFATRQSNVFIIGKGKKSWITLPKDNGVYRTALEERQEKHGLKHH